MKVFLTEKIRKNEEVIKTLQKDLEILKDLLRIEKQVHKKAQTQLSNKEKELEDLRREFLGKEQEMRTKINDLSNANSDKERTIDALTGERKKLKLHKKLLKEEVKKLRNELNETQLKAQNKQVALKSLADFFNNQTLAKIRQMNPDILE